MSRSWKEAVSRSSSVPPCSVIAHREKGPVAPYRSLCLGKLYDFPLREAVELEPEGGNDQKWGHTWRRRRNSFKRKEEWMPRKHAGDWELSAWLLQDDLRPAGGGHWLLSEIFPPFSLSLSGQFSLSLREKRRRLEIKPWERGKEFVGVAARRKSRHFFRSHHDKKKNSCCFCLIFPRKKIPDPKVHGQKTGLRISVFFRFKPKKISLDKYWHR